MQILRSTDTGAPAITNTVGDLTTALDAIIVTGYPLQTITSLTHSAGVITGNLTAHGYSVGDVITISGASPDEYNGKVTIATVPNANSFTYAPVGSNPASSPATGTVKGSTHGGVAGLGWQLAFTGTNVRSYRPRSGSRMYLGVEHNTNAYNAHIRGFETMSAAGAAAANGTGPYPTDAQVSGGLWAQTTINSAGARPWVVFGDEKTLYMGIEVDTTANAFWNWWSFGDFDSFKPSDLYNSMIIGKTSSVTTSTSDAFVNLDAITGNVLLTTAAAVGHYSPRNYQATGGSIGLGVVADTLRHTSAFLGAGSVNSTTLTYPDPISGGLQLCRLYVKEPSVGVRGMMRGLWNVCHSFASMTGVADGDTFSGMTGLAGMNFELRKVGNSTSNGCCAFDTTGPW